MTLTIELAPDLEDELSRAAARQGLDAVTFARAAIEEKLRPVVRSWSACAELDGGGIERSPEQAIQSLDKVLGGLIGVVQSNGGRGGSRLSESTGADFARDLQEKHREGVL
jgi:hypothetical protein